MQRLDSLQKIAIFAVIASSTLVILAATVLGFRFFSVSHSQARTQPTNLPIAGFPLAGQIAPEFSLVNQFNKRVSLSSLRGHEVVLAFIDSECKTLCPLTATIMYNARTQLGSSAANRIELVAVNANPAVTSVASVQAWSIEHGMLHQWSFLTGSAKQLQSIYHLYNVYDQVDANGQAVHDPIMFIIDAQGHERLFFETLNSSSPADLRDQENGLLAGMRQWLPA